MSYDTAKSKRHVNTEDSYRHIGTTVTTSSNNEKYAQECATGFKEVNALTASGLSCQHCPSSLFQPFSKQTAFSSSVSLQRHAVLVWHE